jgi:hypothetical protein
MSLSLSKYDVEAVEAHLFEIGLMILQELNGVRELDGRKLALPRGLFHLSALAPA